jgi:hypothetical protein
MLYMNRLPDKTPQDQISQQAPKAGAPTIVLSTSQNSQLGEWSLRSVNNRLIGLAHDSLLRALQGGTRKRNQPRSHLSCS